MAETGFLSAGLVLVYSPQDLASHTLLHDQDPSTQWSRWFKENDIEFQGANAGPRYTSADMVLTAAMCGQGVALVSEVLAADDLQQGRLIQVLPQVVELGQYYWLVMPPCSQSSEPVSALCQWLAKFSRI